MQEKTSTFSNGKHFKTCQLFQIYHDKMVILDAGMRFTKASGFCEGCGRPKWREKNCNASAAMLKTFKHQRVPMLHVFFWYDPLVLMIIHHSSSFTCPRSIFMFDLCTVSFLWRHFFFFFEANRSRSPKQAFFRSFLVRGTSNTAVPLPNGPSRFRRSWRSCSNASVLTHAMRKELWKLLEVEGMGLV